MRAVFALVCVAVTTACSHQVSAPASTATPTPTTVRLEATVPAAMANGTTIVVVYTPAEIAAGMPRDFNRFYDVLRRVQIVHDVDARDDVVAFDIDVPVRPAVVSVVHDTVGFGLEAVLGPRAGIASGVVDVEAGARTAITILQGKPFAPPPEACVGERLVLLTLDAPETKRAGDDGKRLACVQLPVSYNEGTRRYPVVLTFPGFSGWHASSDTWNARGIFEREGAAVGVEAIVVGVGTRTREGTSYLDSSARFGDWDAYVTRRLLPEIDARFRTTGVRAAVGHSTGGWNALHLAMQHPELVQVVGASAPDALDLDAWLLDAQRPLHVDSDWLAWWRVEAALGQGGQFVSYAASWSPDTSPRGYAWPVDLDSGAVIPEVYAAWRARSPINRLEQLKALSGRVALTVGRHDEFRLFAPAERFALAAQAAGVELLWLPTDNGHFGNDEVRFAPLARFVMTQLKLAPR